MWGAALRKFLEYRARKVGKWGKWGSGGNGEEEEKSGGKEKIFFGRKIFFYN